MSCVNVFYVSNKFHARYRRVELRDEFHFSGVHGAMNRSGSRHGAMNRSGSRAK